MSTTLSMWLGISFLGLAIAAVLLQAWLWGPRFWNEEKKKTEAPRLWLRVHALFGYTYGIIYVVMMWNMLPRLWEYQYELPARTVIHAVVAITIGVLLICKIAILLFFRHFEESMPYYGFGLLLSTVILITLSVPFALRAHAIGEDIMKPENVERVHRLLADVEFDEGVNRDELVTPSGYERGRAVLVNKCTPCHDMRTILTKPRTAKKWYDVSARMFEKPAVFGEQLAWEDVPYVTAYLVAITPNIQESTKRRRAKQRDETDRRNSVGEMVHEGDDFAAPKIDDATGEALLDSQCTQCHELDEIDTHGGDDVAGWRSVVAAMVEEGAEINDEAAAQISMYLAQLHPATGTAAAMPALKDPPPEQPPEIPEKPETPEPAGDTGAAAGDTDGDAAQPDTKADAPKPKPKKPKPKPKKPKPAAEPKPKPKPKPKPAGDAANGRTLFQKKCKTCHGGDGKGKTPFGEKLKVPSIARTSLSRSAVKSKIANGVSGTKMRPYKGKLTPAELDDVTAFVKRL